jgi:transposase
MHTGPLKLSTKERRRLQRLQKQGQAKARVVRRAGVLLLLDRQWSHPDIVAATGASTSTIGRVKRRYLEAGLDAALAELARPGRPPRFDPKARKHLIALACSDPPEGHPKWTCELLAERSGLKKKPSPNTISLLLKAEGIKPWREKNVVHSDD